MITVLLVYRNPYMGFSIGKVFQPIEEGMKDHCEVSSIALPYSNYSLSSLIGNVKALKQHLLKNDYDIVHITGAEHYLLPFLKKENTICTIHDLGFYTQQKNILKRIKKKLLWIDTLKYADVLTFISKKSKDEAKKLVNLKDADCYVVDNPVDSSYRYTPKDFNENCPVLLHIGTKSNKNIERTAEALKGLNVSLRIIGKLTESQLMALKNNNIQYTNAYNLTDEQIKEEYEHCDVVSFPSLYEGFGMPIIEGNAIGRVVVTSNLSPMKEIAGNAAILVDPYQVDSIRQGVLRAIKENQHFVEQGLLNASRFTLSEIVSRYYEIYSTLLDNKC